MAWSAASWATQVELHVVRSRNVIFVQRYKIQHSCFGDQQSGQNGAQTQQSCKSARSNRKPLVDSLRLERTIEQSRPWPTKMWLVASYIGRVK